MGEEHIGFVGILEKIRDVWRDQRQRCLDSAKEITVQLREFAEDGNISRKDDAEHDGLDLELLDEAYEVSCIAWVSFRDVKLIIS